MTLHYRDEGPGPTGRDEGAGTPAVVLLHAFPLNSDMWDAQLAALSSRWRVVAPDLPGFGKSDPLDPDKYSMESFAAEVAALLDELGIEQAVIGGLSIGGYIAFALARWHRPLVKALVLADTRATADAPEVAERRVTQQREIRDEGPAGVIETSVETLLCEYTHEHRPEVVARARALMSRSTPTGMIGALEAMLHRPDATDELAALDVPVLVVVGEHDKPSPPSVAEEMVELLPSAQLAVMPRAGHLSNLEAPEEFNRALVSFLEGLADAG